MNSENNSTILLVEDEAIVARDEAEQIRALGYDVKTTDCGEEAVRLATSDTSIDLVLMEIDLGDGMDGTEAAARILQSRDLPLIFLSSHTEKDIVDRTSRITNYGYVTKTSGVAVLDASIRMAMRLFAANRQVREELERRKRYEHALTESISLNEHIINNLNEGLIVYDTDLRHVVWNTFMERLTGVETSDILGKHPSLVFPELAKTGVIENIELALQGKTPKTIEFTIARRGLQRRLIYCAVPLCDENKRVIGAIATVQNVTEAREDQQRLQKSEAKYRELFENAPVGIFRTDSAGRLLEANAMTARIYGLASGEEAVRHYTDIGTEMWVNPEERNVFVRTLAEIGRVENYEVHSKTADGRRLVVSLNARASERYDSGAFVIEGFLTDITGIRESEKRLEESNAQLNAMLRAMPDKVVRISTDGVFLEFQAREEDLYLAPEVEVIGRQYRDILPPDIADLYDQKIREAVERQALTTFTYTIELYKKGVSLRETRMVPSGKDELIAVIRDITEEAENEALLLESEYLFRTAFDSAPIGVVFEDLDGRLTRVNRAYCEMLGYSEDELIGRRTTEFSFPAEVDRSLEALKRHRDGSPGPMHFTKRYIHRDGSIVWADVNVAVIEDSSGEIKSLFAQVRDITEQRKLEEQLNQTQKMEALGTLAGGIAHDFNNILVPIIGFTDLALTNTPSESTLASHLNQVAKAGVRAKELVKQILSFSRQSVHERLPIIPSLVIDETLKLLRASLPTTIEIRQDTPDDFGTILGDPTQLHQIIMNLCTNAYHAMRETGGVLTVGVSQVTLGESDSIVVAGELGAGNYVKLEVSDTGHGMDRETLEKAFDPYFTTKRKGDGTGLGLSVVHGLVKSHEGYITAHSEPGRGTTFTIYFPRIQEESGLERELQAPPRLNGQERVIVVDDEEPIVQLERITLESLGYKVNSYSSSEEALVAFRSQPDSFDLVVSDMTMPQMTGLDLAKEVLAVRPDIPVIICSGFSELIDEETSEEAGISKYLMKPMTNADFAAAVRDVLDKHKSAEPNSTE